ncbi:hypothetical protein MRX96_054971 [Rhipicephalus microplus]
MPPIPRQERASDTIEMSASLLFLPIHRRLVEDTDVSPEKSHKKSLPKLSRNTKRKSTEENVDAEGHPSEGTRGRALSVNQKANKRLHDVHVPM